MVGAVGYSIGEAARASGLSVKAIRHHEAIGVIPQAGRSNGGAHASDPRSYTAADVGRLRFVYRARVPGLALARIRRMLVVAEGRGCPGRQPPCRQALKNHLHGIDQRMRHLEALRASIADLTAAPSGTSDAVCVRDGRGCFKAVRPAPSIKAHAVASGAADANRRLTARAAIRSVEQSR